MSGEMYKIFRRGKICDRQVDELIGLARGLVADGLINKAEAEYLQKWLVAHADVTDNPIVANLRGRVDQMLADNIFDADEAAELFDTLEKFSGSDFELGEVLKSTSLPLDVPSPQLSCDGTCFCFTGTFAYGSRAECESAVEGLGAKAGSLTKNTDYLVIGIYATESWMHSAYGRKIERAVEMKREGVPIAIVGETHWSDFIRHVRNS